MQCMWLPDGLLSLVNDRLGARPSKNRKGASGKRGVEVYTVHSIPFTRPSFQFFEGLVPRLAQ